MKRGVIVLFALIAALSCGNNTTTAKSCEESCSTTATSSVSTANCVEVLYMHGKQRCVTCVAIGTEAASLINELGDDKVVMRTIDYSTPDGEKIADKYEIASSSIIVVKDGKVDNLTAVGFKYAKSNPELFKKNLNESIQKMLK